MKEYKIGEKFEIEGVEYVVVDDNVDDFPCSGCYFHGSCNCGYAKCISNERSDDTNVHFEKVNS